MIAARAALLLVAATSAACLHGRPSEVPALLGNLDRAAVERRLPDWRQAREEARPDPAAARALRAVAPGAQVIVYLGTWCSDSRREVTRLWHAFDDAGGPLPFTVQWIGVDRDKEEPAALLRGVELERVPTLVVRRAGREVGRIVETAPRGVERELLDLLRAPCRRPPCQSIGTPLAGRPGP